MRISGSELQGKSTLRRIAFRRALFGLPLAAALFIAHAAADDQAASAKTATIQKASGHPHNRADAAKPAAAQPQATPAALPPVEAPKPPDWPADNQPAQATVTWNSQGLRIDAANSSLQQILKDVATATGATLSGMGADQRIFGTYGPGPARDVISQLLDGSGYNVLMIGDQGQGTPRQIVLSKPPAGPAPQVVNGPGNEDNGNADVEEPPQPTPTPLPPQQPPQNAPNGFGPGGQPQPRTPQQILQEMQQRQQQIEQQQQQRNQQ